MGNVEPYYQREGVTLYHADARQVLADIPTYDLLVTDPPYGNGYKTNMRAVLADFDSVQGDDDLPMTMDVLWMAWKKLRINRHAYVFGPIHPEAVIPAEVGGTTELIWDKGVMSGGDLSAPWGNSHETIWFGTKRYIGPRSNSQGKMSARLRKGTVLRVSRAGETSRSHPTQKPVDLLSQLIETSSNREDVVCDPFMGVGSTCVAALLEGRKAIGIEISLDYCTIAADRVDRALGLMKQLRSVK